MNARIKRIASRAQRRPLTSLGLLVVALLLVGTAVVLTQTPRLDRNWVEHLAAAPVIAMHDEGFSVAPVTDWTYDAEGPVRKQVVAFSARYADLRNVWFVVEPQPGGDYAAHTLVLFEFADDRIVGLTVEARREVDEKYDPLLGLFNKYELAYVWSTAKELLNRRAVHLSKEVYVYPLTLSPSQRVRFLQAVLAETQAVTTRPRFYNTLTSNCTNELAKSAGLPWRPSWILTGYSPRSLFELGLIPGRDPAAAKNQARLTKQLRSWNSAPSSAFDRLLLFELRARHERGPIQEPLRLNGSASWPPR